MAIAGDTPGVAAAPPEPLWKAWLQLVPMQALVAGLVLFPFLAGHVYFAYLDIASDTYVISAHRMMQARQFAAEGLSGWSFELGLGAPLAFMYNDVVGMLVQLGGPDNVMPLRIWAYVLKIALGGGFFFLFARAFVQRKEAALLAALAYSFCGYIVTNGVWDSETAIFVTAPLVMWGIERHLRTGDVVSFPLAVAAMLYSGVVFLLGAASLLVAFAACVAASASPRAMARTWLTRLFPLAALGFVIAAPAVLPLFLQLLDSPRVGGADSLLQRFATQGLATSNTFLILTQLGGLFHKDLFGVGGMHQSYMNYLESPGFYAGMLTLVVLPQLWKGAPGDRRLLVAGLLLVAAYMVFPFFRLMAFGFSAPYFRGTTLWVTLGLLVMGLRALDLVLARGADLKLLVPGVLVPGAVLAFVSQVSPVSEKHAIQMAVALGVWGVVFAAARLARLSAARLSSVLLVLLVAELVTTVWPSFFALRSHVNADLLPHKDVTLPALEAVRADKPPAFYRVEKTYDSFNLADAAAQDYRGVKSYYYHGRAVVRFHQALDMLPPFRSLPVNHTNWLHGPGERFMLHSALGVRYVISKTALDWPGFEPLAQGAGWWAYRNDLALPLGVVHTQQVLAADIEKLSSLPLEKARWIKDVVLMNAVVLDALLPQWGRPFDLAGFVAKGEVNTPRHYAQPAQALQRTGLQVSRFSSDRIEGTIRPEAPGILVFSIPAYKGWSLRIDGQPVDLMTADFGLLAAPVKAGTQQVELTYRVPGLWASVALLAAGLAALAAVALRRRRAARS